jgi:predicted TIM-barrel fold metal-dependent hydrolase
VFGEERLKITTMTGVIDSDGHVIERLEEWWGYMPRRYRDRIPTLGDETGSILIFEGRSIPRAAGARHRPLPFAENQFQDMASRRFSPSAYAEAMDIEGIDATVVFPTRGLMLTGIETDDIEFMAAMAHAYNDWLQSFCSAQPNRIFGVGMIDLRDPQGAAIEARRCIEELGFVGVFSRPNPVNGRQLYDPAYDILWNELARLDVPICLHEGGVVELPQVGPDRFSKHSMWHICSHPMEQQLAMVAMILGGVLERHPALRCGFMECGSGWLPYWMWRMDEQYERDVQEDKLEITMLPSEYVRRQCYVVADSDETTAPFALEVLDSKHVVWGSDFPHPDSKFPAALKTVSSLPGIDRFRGELLWDNPLELYGVQLRSGIEAI